MRPAALLLLALPALATTALDRGYQDQDTLETEAAAAATGEGLGETSNDVCFPLLEAHEILAQLQPPANAHLDRKLGGLAKRPDVGWRQDGPLSAAVRLVPRVASALNPLNLLHKLPEPRRASKATRTRIWRLFQLLAEADTAGCADALALRADVLMFPPVGVSQDLPQAFELYSRFMHNSSDPHAQFVMGFFHATGLGGAERDQARATVYYTFSALQGYSPAQMAMGYRYWAGIGVKQDCQSALDYYESAGKNVHARFLKGPPGGETIPLSPSRLSDRFGGIFGPHASWAFTGVNTYRTAVRAQTALARGESETELLEYFQYHADRGSDASTVRLGRYYYLGSVFPHIQGGVSAGAEEIAEIPQSFDKAKRYFYRVARKMWEYDKQGKPVADRPMGDDQRKALKDAAMVAASFLGRMALRGEGMKQDFTKARLWYERAVALGEREAHNGLGIIYRDGLGVPVNRKKAATYFQGAAGLDLPDGQVNVGKEFLALGDAERATQYFDTAVRHGSPFEAFYHLAALHGLRARAAPADGGSPGACGVAVGYYKLVSEIGCWEHDFLGDANRAWARGEEDKAVLGWWIAAEMGSEAGQNNVAFMLERERERGGPKMRVPGDTALMLWTRSAAQGNADAMVMVGDHYYRGIEIVNETRPDYTRALDYYQTAAGKHSSMAYWNVGYMYENGLGVPQDWHLAKRNYDWALEVSSDAYLPWLLSLTKLYIRSWWTEIVTHGETPGLALTEDDPDAPSMWEGIKGLFVSPRLPVRERDAHDAPDAGGDGGGADEYADEEEEYDDVSGAGWEGGGGGEDDDLLETGIILALSVAIMALFWLRNRWALAARQGQVQVQVGEGGARDAARIPVGLAADW